MDILQTAKHSKSIKQPDNEDDYNNGIKNSFDSPLHRNVAINQPEKYSDNNKNDNYS